MSRTYKITCLSECLSPLTHASGTEGNESIVFREPVRTARGVAYVPAISGNAIRHRCVREPGMRRLVAECGLAGKLSLTQLNFLFHGGSLTEGGGVEDFGLIAETQRIAPLVKLVGGSLPRQILSGCLHAGRGVLVCEENQSHLAAILGADNLPDRLRPAESFISRYQYNRGDAAKSFPAATVGPAGSNLMIFSGQAVLRGAAFVHTFVVRHGELTELGALVDALAAWQADGGTVGGQSARGHGALLTAIVSANADLEEARGLYRETVAANREAVADWLARAFAAKAEPPTKKGKAAS